ncbi:hypothetical protein Syun_017338 [Stephania yunnanensis]|uniref:Uncharacterized protein n=1 Tax=Stephania yunnanensis TaxID=152371 RepID=A0AAP0J6R9_9MAGN
MGSVLSALVATALISSLAAFTNNSYNARNFLMSSPIFGSQAIGLRDLKYSAATVSLIASFLFSSIAVGCFVEAQFLPIFPKLQEGYIEKMLERGFLLAFLGNRALQFSFPLLLWMLGSVPFALSTLTLIWLQYELDFNRSHGINCRIKGSA